MRVAVLRTKKTFPLGRERHLEAYGGHERYRTSDLLNVSQALYH